MRNTMTANIYDAIVDYWNSTAMNDEYFDLSVEYCEKVSADLSFLGYEIDAENIYDVYGDLLAEEREELCFIG